MSAEVGVGVEVAIGIVSIWLTESNVMYKQHIYWIMITLDHWN